MTTLVDHKTKTELALQVLRDRIRTGELEPGQRLRLNDLTAELGMSPTPIREALRLLQADGLVDYRPHQGIVVAELSLERDGRGPPPALPARAVCGGARASRR